VASQAATPAREAARRPSPSPFDGGAVEAAVTRQHRRLTGRAREGQSCAPAEVAGRSDAEGILEDWERSNWGTAGARGEETGLLLAAATRGAAVVCSAWPPSQEQIVFGLVPGACARYVGYPSPL
jgi:hypothetical protein